MGLIVGIVAVIACTIGGYMAMGGKVYVLWQPFEVVIIVGSAIGAYITGNSKDVIKATGGAFKAAMKGSKYKKEHYVELLSVLYQVLKLAKTKGNLGLEPHVENPDESSLFNEFPGFMENKTAVTFLCDYLRLLTLGCDDPHEDEQRYRHQELVEHHTDVA